MPNGPVHFAALQKRWPVVIGYCAVVLIVGFLWFPAYASYFLEYAIWVLIWYYCARWVDPDLDQKGVTAAEGRAERELGFVGMLFNSYFAFYAHLMGYIVSRTIKDGMFGGAHHSKLTHSVIPGTPIRMAFLYFPLPTFLQWIQIAGDFALRTAGMNTVVIQFAFLDILMYVLGQFTALGYADSIHISLDKKFGD